MEHWIQSREKCIPKGVWTYFRPYNILWLSGSGSYISAFFVLLKNIVSHRQPYPSSRWMKVSDGIKQTPRVHDWNVSNNTPKRRPALHADRQATGGELMIVKWGQTTETQAEGGRQRRDGGEGGKQGAKVITLSLVHCCLLSDLIWSRRHTWAKAHPSQVLQDPFIAPLPSIHPSTAPFPRLSLLLLFSFKAPSIAHHLSPWLSQICFSPCHSLSNCLSSLLFVSARKLMALLGFLGYDNAMQW